MEEPEATLTEIIRSGEELAAKVSHHPAIVQDDIKKKKLDSSEIMDVNYGNELDQLEQANSLVAEIDDQIKQIYKSVRSKYSTRFPELQVSDPMQYIITVQLLANKPKRISDESIKKQLSEMLDPKMFLLVTMTAATTQGIKIDPDEMKLILQTCAVAIHLAGLRSKLLDFVESNMAKIAPNLSVILGAPIAAKLMGLAGGLMKLANMPACNIPILGSHRASKIESDINAPLRVGLIYECDLIQQIPFDHTKDVRKRAVKWVANKCCLAARCDISHQDTDGNAGRIFREKIEAQINKELEPPPKKALRPLPAPIEKSGKKRGGKRVRRIKERYAVTELRKAANRVTFGDVGDDAYQDGIGLDRTQLNAIQKLRGPQISDKTKIRLSKRARKMLAKEKSANEASDNSGKKANNNGEAASITVRLDQQEMSIFNPNARENFTQSANEQSSSYFSNNLGFLAIKREEPSSSR